MDPLALSPSAVRLAGSSSTFRWLQGAWRLFRLAPLRILLLSLSPIVLAGLCQLLPVVGIVVSKLLAPLAMAWVMAMLDQRVRTGRFDALHAARQCLQHPWVLVGLAGLGVGVFAFQLAVAAGVAGSGQALAIALGQVHEITMSRAQVALMLAAGTLPQAALMFVLPRALLDGGGLRQALSDNAVQVRTHWRAVVSINLLMAALVGALLWLPVLLLVAVPLGACVGYAAYRDVFAGRMPEAAHGVA